MASISRRGDMQWQARVRRKGYPVQIKTFNTRADAEAWARQVESEIDRGADAVTRAFQRAVTRARVAYEAECATEGKTPDKQFLTDLWFHDLCHEATSRLASIFPMHELAKITGHRDPRMLMRYYHPRAEELAKKLG